MTELARGPSRRFSVVMTCAAFEPGFRGGGPIRSAVQIVDNAPDDVDLKLITKDRDLGQSEPYPALSGKWVHRGAARVYYLNTRSFHQWSSLLAFLRGSRTDLLYVNSLFEPTFSILPILAAKMGLVGTPAILIAPRGELSPGALALKAAKKRWFIKMWSRLLRGMSVTWHASAGLEAAHIRQAFLGAAVVINQDQSSLPDEPIPPQASGPRAKLIFVSRISPKKNLDGAIAALREVKQEVDFDIFGPVEDHQYWQKCQSLIAELPANVHVEYCGELAPEEVRNRFAQYDAFLFPTRGENFGHVIAESLSASCPVICTDQTPWTDALRSGGGYVIDDTTLPLVLDKIASSSSAERLNARHRSGDAFHAWRCRTRKESIFDSIRV